MPGKKAAVAVQETLETLQDHYTKGPKALKALHKQTETLWDSQTLLIDKASGIDKRTGKRTAQELKSRLAPIGPKFLKSAAEADPQKRTTDTQTLEMDAYTAMAEVAAKLTDMAPRSEKGNWELVWQSLATRANRATLDKAVTQNGDTTLDVAGITAHDYHAYGGGPSKTLESLRCQGLDKLNSKTPSGAAILATYDQASESSNTTLMHKADCALIDAIKDDDPSLANTLERVRDKSLSGGQHHTNTAKGKER